VALYNRFNTVNVLPQASVPVIVMTSLDTGHADILSVNDTVGAVPSKTIVSVVSLEIFHRASFTLI
jgi:hypothetical protein